MVKIFGWSIKRDQEEELPSFTPAVKDDGAVVVAAGGTYGMYIDLEGAVRNESQLVSKYRDMALHPEVDGAVNQITNEAIVQEDDAKIVEIILDDVPINDTLKKAITDEFERIQELLEFNSHAYDIFRRFYIDGRMYFHAIIDDRNVAAGIQELRYIDPRKIRKVREVVPIDDKSAQKMPGSEVLTKTKQEYYMYNPSGFVNNTNPSFQYSSPAQGLKIAKDCVVHITSGITDPAGTLVLGFLHKAIKPLNQLRALEDAAIIYRLARAPERRIFYVDVGNLPKNKAEQFMRDIMAKYKNRLVYDATTGEIRDDRRFQTMLEDFWIPRREGGKGTEIDVLPPGNATGVMDEVEFFKQRLYASLNVPYDRTDPQAMFALGPRMTEITRDEVNFSKFIDRCRLRFNQLFLKILEKQLVLKKIILPEEFRPLAYKIKFKYAKDNIFAELKEREVMNDRMNTLNLIAPFVGRYYSNEWIRKNVLKQTDADIQEITSQIALEATNPLYQQPLGMPGMEEGPEAQPPMLSPVQGSMNPSQVQANLNKGKKLAKKSSS